MPVARVVELVDTGDLKSPSPRGARVRVSPRALKQGRRRATTPLWGVVSRPAQPISSWRLRAGVFRLTAPIRHHADRFLHQTNRPDRAPARRAPRSRRRLEGASDRDSSSPRSVGGNPARLPRARRRQAANKEGRCCREDAMRCRTGARTTGRANASAPIYRGVIRLASRGKPSFRQAVELAWDEVSIRVGRGDLELR
jgi:hypothetical protein